MTIDSRDKLLDALGNSCTNIVVSKTSLASAAVGQLFSLWQAAGIPGAGATPTAAAVCTNVTAGGASFSNPVAPAKSYLARLAMMCSNSAAEIQVHDRLMAQGGLNGTVTTAQTINVDATNGGLTDRIGDANYSDVQWWLEWYTATGATAVNATVAVTYGDGSTANIVVALAATTRAGRLMPILSTTAGRFIRSVQSVTLSATTATAGNFGVTATRLLAAAPLGVAFAPALLDWAALGLPRVPDSACLQLVTSAAGTTTGSFNGQLKLVQG